MKFKAVVASFLFLLVCSINAFCQEFPSGKQIQNMGISYNNLSYVINEHKVIICTKDYNTKIAIDNIDCISLTYDMLGSFMAFSNFTGKFYLNYLSPLPDGLKISFSQAIYNNEQYDQFYILLRESDLEQVGLIILIKAFDSLGGYIVSENKTFYFIEEQI